MPIDRRTALAFSAAAVVAPTLIGRASPAFAQTAAPAGQAPGFYRYKVGDITITAVNDGFFARPLEGFIKNAELPAVQETMKAAFLPTDKLPIPFTTLVVQTGGKTVLLDTGNGDMGAPTSGLWLNNFTAAGFDPAKVDTVIISHYHADHINGLTPKDGKARFPNAEILVGATENAFWMSDDNMNKAPEAARGGFMNARRAFAPYKDRIKTYEGDKEVAPGITAVSAFGHTPGHSAFAIQSGNSRFMFMADVTNHPALFVRNPDWAAIFDQDAEMARATRRKMLDMVAQERMQVAFYHAPFPATGYVARDGNGFAFVPAAWSSAP